MEDFLLSKGDEIITHGYRAQTSVECNNYHGSRAPSQELSGILPRLVGIGSRIGWFWFWYWFGLDYLFKSIGQFFCPLWGQQTLSSARQ
jgi:hypothetical protein